MLSMVGRLAGWARRTTSFAEMGTRTGSSGPWESARHEPEPPEPTGSGCIYRLRRWPSLPSAMRTAPVLQLLSVMSTRPVNRGWMVRHTALAPEFVDRLIERLQRDGAVDIIDPSGFGALPVRS